MNYAVWTYNDMTSVSESASVTEIDRPVKPKNESNFALSAPLLAISVSFGFQTSQQVSASRTMPLDSSNLHNLAPFPSQLQFGAEERIFRIAQISDKTVEGLLKASLEAQFLRNRPFAILFDQIALYVRSKGRVSSTTMHFSYWAFSSRLISSFLFQRRNL
jgi:hypothetical protein